MNSSVDRHAEFKCSLVMFEWRMMSHSFLYWSSGPERAHQINGNSGYVHTGPVPNGSDPILERTISFHTVPFRLSTSVHTGPVCYGSVLNRSKKSSCFYQLSMRRIRVVAFKMAPKKLNCAASTKRNRSRCLHGDGSVWDRNGSKTGPAFFGGPVFEPDRERIDGTVSRSRVNKRPIRHDF